MRGLERRITAGLSPDVRSVASVFLSRWDGATIEKVPDRLRDKLGIAIGQQVYKAYRDILASDRWQRLTNFGARPQRLLFASTGTKDPKASDVLYIGALAAPNTVNTIPEKTLMAFADHGKLTGTLPPDGGDCEAVLDDFRKGGIDLDQLAAELHRTVPRHSINRGRTTECDRVQGETIETCFLIGAAAKDAGLGKRVIRAWPSAKR